MTLLKLKRLFYRYTGVYFGHKEENKYIDSKEYWDQFIKIAKNPKNDMSLRDIHGLMVGMWQTNNGFTRPSKWMRHWRKRPRFFFKFIFWFVDLYLVVKWDLEELYRKLRKPYFSGTGIWTAPPGVTKITVHKSKKK